MIEKVYCRTVTEDINVNYENSRQSYQTTGQHSSRDGEITRML